MQYNGGHHLASSSNPTSAADLLSAYVMQVLNCVIYPRYSYDAPILGIDFLAFGKNKVLAILDLQPLTQDPAYRAFPSIPAAATGIPRHSPPPPRDVEECIPATPALSYVHAHL